ncbi:MAG: penicillin acylase family protein [Solirubrobacterales bacterium]|nr:penicillin acylase family protein [Solirubrobacterales bacterium]
MNQGSRARNRALLVTLAATLAAVLLAVPSAALAQLPPDGPEPGAYQEDDAGGFLNIIPPGQNGHTNGADIAAFFATGQRPPHSDDQIQMYEDLVYAYDNPGFDRGSLTDYFKDASFGVPAGEAERTYSPRPDVTIVRDSDFGVPHIYGSDRSGAMFGIGYATAEDRLFFMDVLRHTGRAQLSSFVGGSESNREMDQSVWADTPYRERELQLQYDRADELYGESGEQIQQDVQDYIDGINAYIAEARVNPAKLPGEYAAVGQPLEDFKVTDVIATAALVAGIFGKGGGGELDSAQVLLSARKRFGKGRGTEVWEDFRSANDAEAPTTVHKRRFPYQTEPRDPKGTALPDRGSVREAKVVVASTGGGQAAASTQYPGLASVMAPLLEQSGMSNALLVSGEESASGTPIAVMGPQVSYFTPQILTEQDVHAPATAEAPGIDARGTAFPGTNLYVQLGRGDDYAWSATSAGQDIVDTYAVPLCEPEGGRPTFKSKGYRFRGKCQSFDVLRRTNAWKPSAADQTPPGTETLRTQRTKLGIVVAKARIKGAPYAYTRLRSTYFHETDPSVLGFSDFNNPRKMDTPKEFFKAANKIDLTFNWFYANENKIAYFNSGSNPVRPKGTDPSLPVFGTKRFVWKRLDTKLQTSAQAPLKSHPHVVDQDYLSSWNNKQAKGYAASDDNYAYGSVYRSDSLDERIERGIKGQRKMNLVELVQAMEDAGTVDLRGSQVLPWALRVVESGGRVSAPARRAIRALRAWLRDGAHRRDADDDGTYEHARAVQIMDAWWPKLIAAEFRPTLGKGLYNQIQSVRGTDDTPHKPSSNQGSAYNGGWYHYAEKDLRTILGAPVRDRYSRVYCGGGKLAKCRKRLLGSLVRASNARYAKVYAGADDCGQGDPQWCFDAVEHLPLGAITQPSIHWINRPTFQQVIEIGR